MSETLRVGLVSCAHVHAQGLAAALATLARVSFSGIYDDDLARARTVAAPWAAARPGDARVYASLDELLAQSDAVVIASTNADHRRYTEAAARAGVHVLCEKPLATSLADADAMIEACRAAGVQLGILFPVRASPAVAAVRDAIGSGALGRVRAVRATNPGQYPGLWFGDPKQAGGGAVMDHTVHASDAIRWLLGQEYTRVHAELGSFIHRLAVEDCGLITCDLEQETFASIDCSWSRPSTFPTWGGVTLHVVGERATIDVDVFRQALTHYDDAAGRTRLIGWGDDLTSRTVGAFVDAVLDGRPVPIDGTDGLRALEVAVAAYRSSDAGAPIAIADLRR